MRALLIILILILVLIVALSVAHPTRHAHRVVPWHADIETLTRENENWRDVIYTSEGMQIALMSVPVGAELGAEVHPDNDQFFRVESGTGELIAGTHVYALRDGSAAVVPRGIRHNVVNTSDRDPLKLYTIYSPPHHLPHTRDRTHADELTRERSQL
jgi:mannose-6-phosphate isomerase-like protein (cupin superfamily)